MRLVKRRRETQFITAGQIRRDLSKQIRTEVSVVVQEWAVRIIPFTGEERTDLVLGGREHENISLGIELSSCRLRHPLFHNVPGPKIHRPGRIEVAEFGKVRALLYIQPFDGFRDDEIQIGITLSVSMRTEVDRHTVGKECDVGSVVRIEAS